eukprot:3143688-Pleurochrysis_carterae.AAC.2
MSCSVLALAPATAPDAPGWGSSVERARSPDVGHSTQVSLPVLMTYRVLHSIPYYDDEHIFGRSDRSY